ncbi:MAG: CcmD family protein [Actinobacteria bacterium]|nr:CcmD family protein [Actinomycetota bacterium]
MNSGLIYVFFAYGFIWLLLLAYMLYLANKQKKIGDELKAVKKELEKRQ